MGRLDPRSDLQGIAAFVHAVESGSFTGAAMRMGLTKSAVGKSVARLEAQLGVRLLERTTRSLGMTAEGRAYHATCIAVLAELLEAEAALAARQQTVTGRLSINVPVAFGRLWIAPIMTAFAGRHVGLSLEMSFADRRVDMIEEGVDLVVRIGDPGDHSGLMTRRLATTQWLLCAAPYYLERHGRPTSPSDVTRHACLGFQRDGRALPWQAWTDEGLVSFHVPLRHCINHGEALRDAVLAGLGLAYLPTWLVGRDLAAGTLETILSPSPVDGEPIHILWRRAMQTLPKVRAGIDALVAGFSPAAPWSRPEAL